MIPLVGNLKELKYVIYIVVKTADEEIRSLLGVPENYAVLNLIAIGEKA